MPSEGRGGGRPPPPPRKSPPPAFNHRQGKGRMPSEGRGGRQGVTPPRSFLSHAADRMPSRPPAPRPQAARLGGAFANDLRRGRVTPRRAPRFPPPAPPGA